ncbi:MAG: phosphodiester glycosidase family protein [Pseudomonadota bacterium]
MKHHLFIAALLLSLIPSSCAGTPKSAYTWNQMAKGLEYATYSFAISEKERVAIHAFRIDPKLYRFDVAMAPNEKQGATVEELAKRDKALVVINGGFFTPEHLSIGLIIKNGKKIRPLHKTSWWSVFAVRDDKPSITSPSKFKEGSDISMSIQVGPRLVIDGNIPKLKSGISTRSAIGITKNDRVVIVITQGYGITMKELASRMKNSPWEGGLGCPNAMALDGGSSSQLFAKIGKFELSLEGLSKITNGVAVFKKSP